MNLFSDTHRHGRLLRLIAVLLALSCILTAPALPEDRALAAGSPRVRTMGIAGKYLLKPGELFRYTVRVSPAGASKNVTWKSSNPRVASISSTGYVRGKHFGYTVITATSRDGSHKKAALVVAVFGAQKGMGCRIAHRGRNDLAPENTKAAFHLAGKTGFWGAECDIWETKHASDGSFDLVVCHNSTYTYMTGKQIGVKSVTAAQAKRLKVKNGSNATRYHQNICFLKDFLAICQKYDMVPVIELKDERMSRKGYQKVLRQVQKYGFANNVIFISFKSKALLNLKKECNSMKKAGTFKRKKDLITYHLSSCRTKAGGREHILLAKKRGFTGVGFNKKMDPEVMKYADALGMRTHVWGFKKSSREAFLSWVHRYVPDMITSDGNV